MEKRMEGEMGVRKEKSGREKGERDPTPPVIHSVMVGPLFKS